LIYPKHEAKSRSLKSEASGGRQASQESRNNDNDEAGVGSQHESSHQDLPRQCRCFHIVPEMTCELLTIFSAVEWCLCRSVFLSKAAMIVTKANWPRVFTVRQFCSLGSWPRADHTRSLKGYYFPRS